MAGPDIPPDILRLTEVFVFASHEPVTETMLHPLLPDHLAPLDVLVALRRHCAGRGVVLFQAGEGWAFRTAPDLPLNLQAAFTAPRRIPQAAMEILAIIALRQPVTRLEIEQGRGAGLSQTSMDILLETGLIKPWGRKDAPGRPVLWVTTEGFLAQFGLATLGDLPGAQMVSMWPEGGAETETDDNAPEEGRGMVAPETNGTSGAASDQ